MDVKILNNITVINSPEIIIKDGQSALDFIVKYGYEANCKGIAINKSAVIEEFFDLKTGIAGEVLQKFTNFHTKLAIYGDFTKYTSKPLRDFMYESNKGNDIYFSATEEEAIKKLKAAV